MACSGHPHQPASAPALPLQRHAQLKLAPKAPCIPANCPSTPPGTLPGARSKSIEKRGPGVGYGFVVAMCFTLAFFVLLCGLVLDGFKDVVHDDLEVKREHQGRRLSRRWQWVCGSRGCVVRAAFQPRPRRRGGCLRGLERAGTPAAAAGPARLEACWCSGSPPPLPPGAPPLPPRTVAGTWSKYNTGEYVGTIAFAYICFVMFIAFFFALIVFQSAVSEELGIGAAEGGARGRWWGLGLPRVSAGPACTALMAGAKWCWWRDGGQLAPQPLLALAIHWLRAWLARDVSTSRIPPAAGAKPIGGAPNPYAQMSELPYPAAGGYLGGGDGGAAGPKVPLGGGAPPLQGLAGGAGQAGGGMGPGSSLV